MRVNKKEINNIMNILDLNLRRANNTLDNIVAIVNKYIPSIISIDKDKYCINVKTDLIYDIHKSYFKDIRDIGIDINKVKSMDIEFLIDYNRFNNKTIVCCYLNHIVDNEEKKLFLSKKEILKVA